MKKAEKPAEILKEHAVIGQEMEPPEINNKSQSPNPPEVLKKDNGIDSENISME